MPTWSTELPKLGKHMGFDLRRTPATGALQAIITCENILVCDTHFYHGRTTPCEKPDCTACNESIPYRTHVYVSAFDAKAREHFIFECTANAAKALVEYHDAATTLRGCVFHASRPKGLKNSKVCIQTNTVNLAKVQLPEPPNLILALSVIWRLPLAALPIEHQRHHSPEVKTRSKPLRTMRTQPDNAADDEHLERLKQDVLEQLNASIAGNGQHKREASPA
jgi:hypothetical protein